ncbi:MAG: hypothetical protein IVW56_09635 [Candidatus Binataceae bacterium]|nr:hypothetical protein [Candidatus Binataceae bacterium]
MIESRPAVAGTVKLRAPNAASASTWEDAGDGCVWVPAAQAGALVESHGFRFPGDPEPEQPPTQEEKRLTTTVEQLEARVTGLAAEMGDVLLDYATRIKALGDEFRPQIATLDESVLTLTSQVSELIGRLSVDLTNTKVEKSK